ncbi:MAG: M20/M25/M40 family metallo-hydrolase [Lachnospiraceae bacterium]|nr:M20/M25/M40 family metallo-hydrolase [Lachnospiraceae bacterium]
MDMDNTTLQMIKDLSNAFGAPGFEEEVAEVARKWADPFVEYSAEDPMHNLMLFRKGNSTQGDKPVLMLDAHSDEVAFMIQAIRPNGMLDFLSLGHWDPSTVPAHRVWIRNRFGKLITGIVASVPVHYQKEMGTKELSITNMVIDVGATCAEEVRDIFGIEVGDPVVPAVDMEVNAESGVLMGKAFDCRIGCAVVLEVLKRLAGEELGVDVIGTLTTQEEVGGRGARATVHEVCPDISIVLEGAPADDSFMPEYRIQTGLKRGPMMRHMDVNMIANARMARMAIDTAGEIGIPLQRAVRSGGGTNGGLIHDAIGAVPCVVLSVPVRYTHSHHTFCAIQDFEQTVQLVCAMIRKINEDFMASL